MSSQISPFEKIHTGLWTDYAQDGAGRLTLTVTSTTGTYLIAFLAIFVRLTAGHFWDICCFVWFHFSTTDQAKDGLYHQRQALLRNNLSDSRALWQFTTTAWAWRKKTHHPIARSLPIIMAALVHFVAFTMAGIFSSKVAAIHPNVLISGPTCGVIEAPKDDGSQASMVATAELSTQQLSIYRTSLAQATGCHAFNTTGSSQNQRDCRPWGRKFLPFTVRTDVSCPFAKDMCMGEHAVEIESDLIDSTHHLGINAPIKDRVQFRHRMQCAPVRIDGYKHELTNFNETGYPAVLGQSPYEAVRGYIGYAYGQRLILDNHKYTYVYYNTTFGDDLGGLQPPSYVVDMEPTYLNDTAESSFEPIPQLSRTDADVTMWFISQNQLNFVSPNHDPIFGATVPRQTQVLSDLGQIVNMTYWTPPEPVSVLSCAQQYQWCQPNGKKECTAWNAMHNIDVSSLNFNERQYMVQHRIRQQFFDSNINLLTPALKEDCLLATTATGWGQAGSSLPDDQWLRELDHWTSIFYNALQLSLAQYSVGNGVAAQDKYRTLLTPDWKWMCDAQVVQRGNYASFNMLGLLLILCLGVFFVIINVSMASIMDFIGRRRATKAGLQWISHWRNQNVLQLQSFAFASAGLGNWEHGDLVPTTNGKQEFRFPSLKGMQYSPVLASEEEGPGVVYENKLPDVYVRPSQVALRSGEADIGTNSGTTLTYEGRLPADEESISPPSSARSFDPTWSQPPPSQLDPKRWVSKFSTLGSGLAGQKSHHQIH